MFILPLHGGRHQRLPAGDGPGTVQRQIIIRDAGEQPARLDDGGELTTMIEGGADRGDF